MSEIKQWALSICIILIVSGIFMRILPERSDKSVVRFVVTLILITVVFGIDISSFEDAFDLEIASESVENDYEDSLLDKVGNSLCEQVERLAESECRSFGYDAECSAEIEDGKIVIYIASQKSLGDSEIEAVRSIIEAKLGEEAEIRCEG